MKNEENFNYPFGQCLGRLDRRLTKLHELVTVPFFNHRTMRMCEEWEELAKEFHGNK